MAWIDRQVPEGDEIFYDHIGYFVPNLETAGAQLEKLGFQVSAINIQYNENEAGELSRDPHRAICVVAGQPDVDRVPSPRQLEGSAIERRDGAAAGQDEIAAERALLG